MPRQETNQQTSSATKAIQAIKHPIPKLGLFQRNPNQQQTQGFIESTFPMNHTLPVSQEVSESEDSDLDDFFPQTDPLSGLTFHHTSQNLSDIKNINEGKYKGNTPKPSTSLNIEKRSPSSQLEDFTGKYGADEEESYTCGICNQFETK